MSTPEKPRTPRRKKPAVRKKPAPRKAQRSAAPGPAAEDRDGAGRGRSVPARREQVLGNAEGGSRKPREERVSGSLAKRATKAAGARVTALHARAGAARRRVRIAWHGRKHRPLDPETIPPVREPWLRRLRHRWRRSRLAREGLPLAIARLGAYARLTRINRPIGTFLLLWPTLWALWLASGGHPSPWYFVVFVLGTFLMRSAGCAMNDFADRRFDPHVWRTKDRPLARGEIHPGEALALFCVLGLGALGLVLTLDRLALWLSLPGAFLAATYPFMKRFTQLPQLYLGVAFGWGIPMAFAAVTGHVPSVAWLLLIVNILWATAYDTMYAMADRPDDVKIGVKSTAILFGEMDRTIVGILQATVLVGLALAGLRLHLQPVYYWGLGAAACFAVYEQWLIREREPVSCFQAFLNNNWFGAAVFAGIILQIPFSH